MEIKEFVVVVGIGGIENYKDVIEFLMAGVSLIEVGTANFINPYSCLNIINGIQEFMEK